MRTYLRYAAFAAVLGVAFVEYRQDASFAAVAGPVFIALVIGLQGRYKKVACGIFSLLRSANSRAERQILERYCEVETEKGRCGELAAFFLAVTLDDAQGFHDPRAGIAIRCCAKHHPFASHTNQRGKLASETSAMLRRNNLSVERIGMIPRIYG